MNITELAEFMELNSPGRYEVYYLGDKNYIVTLLMHNEILVTKEAHEQNIIFFRNRPV